MEGRSGGIEGAAGDLAPKVGTCPRAAGGELVGGGGERETGGVVLRATTGQDKTTEAGILQR